MSNINNTTTTNKTARFTINFFQKTITGTKLSFNKAGKGSGAEYEELTAKMAAHPDFKLVIKEQEKKSPKAKRTYKGMDFSFMEAFISIQKEAEAIRKEYDAYKKFAEEAGMKVYPATKKWFLEKFAPNGAEFNMAEALEAIKAAQYQAINAQVSTKLAEAAAAAKAGTTPAPLTLSAVEADKKSA